MAHLFYALSVTHDGEALQPLELRRPCPVLPRAGENGLEITGLGRVIVGHHPDGGGGYSFAVAALLAAYACAAAHKQHVARSWQVKAKERNQAAGGRTSASTFFIKVRRVLPCLPLPSPSLPWDRC